MNGLAALTLATMGAASSAFVQVRRRLRRAHPMPGSRFAFGIPPDRGLSGDDERFVWDANFGGDPIWSTTDTAG
jgi:hypothetical protein